VCPRATAALREASRLGDGWGRTQAYHKWRNASRLPREPDITIAQSSASDRWMDGRAVSSQFYETTGARFLCAARSCYDRGRRGERRRWVGHAPNWTPAFAGVTLSHVMPAQAGIQAGRARSCHACASRHPGRQRRATSFLRKQESSAVARAERGVTAHVAVRQITIWGSHIGLEALAGSSGR
jgi:hypothetical protein